MNDRIIKQTTVIGLFLLPMGLSFYGRKIEDKLRDVLVSTVRLDDGHLEDQLGILGPETGFETMVFLCGYATSGSLHTAHHETYAQAIVGHDLVVRQIEEEALPLTLPLHYCAHKSMEGDHSEHKRTCEKERTRLITF